MSYFAKVLNGKVVQVIAAEPEFFTTFVDSSPGEWIQTSYNTRGGVHYNPDTNEPDGGIALRGNYAGIGYVYDSANDVFYQPRPVDKNGVDCVSWTISAPNWTWQPPIPYPVFDENITGKQPSYEWDEVAQNWVTSSEIAE